MLSRVLIRNFILIEEAELDFQAGLNVISGETGAGKSILMDALLCLFGARSSRDYVRQGAEAAELSCQIDGVLSALPEATRQALALTELDLEEDSLLIMRRIDQKGRSTVRINGQLQPLTLLRELADQLVELHGQNEQLQLFRPEIQLSILDRYAELEDDSILERYQQNLTERQIQKKRLQRLGNNPQERALRLDLLYFQRTELLEADLKVGELDRLKQEARRLAAFSQLASDLELASTYLQVQDSSVDQQLAQSAKSLDFAAKHNQACRQVQTELFRLAEELAGVRRELLTLAEKVPSQEEAEFLNQERQSVILRLLAKYGGSEAAALASLEKIEEEITLLEEAEASSLQVQKELVRLTTALQEDSALIHHRREAAAQNLSAEITRSLQALNMSEAKFQIVVEQDLGQDFTFNGQDRVCFCLEVNPGEGMGELARIASGGEASRILLAIKACLAAQDALAIMMFDEIDAGISGQTSNLVAETLLQLSQTQQLIVVSHSAQICARADSHFYLSKEHVDGRTRSMIRKLDAEARCHEIARLLSGRADDPHSLDLARVMIEGGVPS